MVNPWAVCTKPRQAVGMLTRIKMAENKTLAPYTSHIGPTTSLTKMVDPTPAMLDVQMSCLVSPKSSFMYGRRGRTANHMKNATMKLHHAQWKALLSMFQRGEQIE
jgi:hypothetical protein